MRPGPRLHNISVPAPAAGVDWSYEVPGSLGQCLVLQVSFRLNLGAAVANRSVALNLTDPSGNTKGRAESDTLQVTPAGTVRYVFGMTGTAYLGASGDNDHVPLQNGYVRGNDFIRTIVNNLQAADTLDRIFIWLEEFADSP